MLLNTPADVIDLSGNYISIIFAGLIISMLYNVCSALLRAIGDSITPLIFLAVSVVLNIFLDLLCIFPLAMGVQGARGRNRDLPAHRHARVLFLYDKTLRDPAPAPGGFSWNLR